MIDEQEVEKAKDAAETLAGRYLRERGWVDSSNTPGAFWLWGKQLADGRYVMVSREMAVTMQQYIEIGDGGDVT